MPDAVAALPPLGAGLVEIGPVAAADVPAFGDVLHHVDLLVTTAERRGGVLADETVEALRGDGRPGVVVRDAEPGVVARVRRRTASATIVAVSDAARPSALAELVDAGADIVLATVDALVEGGPGLFQRTAEAAAGGRGRPARFRDVPRAPHRWPGRAWGTLLGLGMLATGPSTTPSRCTSPSPP